MSPKKTITYHYRGMIERGNGKPGYSWREGYSAEGPNGEVTYPWLTYRECQRDAKAEGCRAVFKRPPEPDQWPFAPPRKGMEPTK
jgi:hypothetical protein